MSAVIFKRVLVGAIVLLVCGLIGGGYWMSELLTASASEADHLKIDADVSALEVQQLKQLKTQLLVQNDIVERAHQIGASISQYKYQDQVIEDVNSYAARYGIQVSNFDFTAPAAGLGAKASGSKTPFKVSLQGPIAYESFLRFLHDIETNLTRIQVTSLSLAPDKDPSLIANPTLSLEVYLKK
jgi:hypothetical protein